MCKQEEKMRLISAKPGMPFECQRDTVGKTMRFCHQSLSEAQPGASHSQKASWVRKLAELLVQFWSLSETKGL